MTVRWRGRHVFDSLAAGKIDGVPQSMVGEQFYVSVNDGSDTNVGTSPDKPLKTLERARVLNNALVDWAHDNYKYNVIWVEPGIYDEYFEGGFYYSYLVGLGGNRQDVQIRPSEDGGVFRSNATLINEVFQNIHFQSLIQDVATLDLGTVNYVKFLGCKFSLAAAVTGVKAIDISIGCADLELDDCDFTSGETEDFDYGIYQSAGFCHNALIRNNRIHADLGGIYHVDGVIASEAHAIENDIHINTTGIGIDGKGGGGDSGSSLLAIKNRIIVDGLGDAIHGLDAGNKLHNETNVNGTFAYETA